VGNAAGFGSDGTGYSLWIIEAWVAVMERGLMPHASNVQYGAPSPPLKRDHTS